MDDIKAGAFKNDDDESLEQNDQASPNLLDLNRATTVKKVYRKMMQRFERAYQNKVHAFLEEFVADTFVAPLNEKLLELLY